jgi:hypothetical protein
MPSTKALPAPLTPWSSYNVGKARWVNCLMVVENSCRGSTMIWVLVFSWVRYAATRSCSPNWSLSTPIVSLYIVPLGTQCRTFEAWPCRAVKWCMAFMCDTHL